MKKQEHFPWLPFTPISQSSKAKNVLSSDGIYLHLEGGGKVMDMISSWWVSVHGHANKKIAESIYEQAKKLEQVIYANFTHDPANTLQEMLTTILPEGLNAFFFSDNGSTAVEVGLKMAFQYWKNIGCTKRNKFISFEGAYHGDTLGAMSVSGRSIFTDTFKELLYDVTYLSYPETWEGDEEVERKEQAVLDRLEEILEKQKEEYAALITEPLIQGAGGMRMCRPTFLQKLETLCRRYDLLIIYDEVMTGFGRTGEFFAAKKSNTSPDIICLSKALTGGFLPMSLTVANEKVLKGFTDDDPLKTFYHGHSYTANPLGCAAGIASLEILQSSLSFKQFEGWHREFIFPLAKQFDEIQKVRLMGTIGAFTLDVGKDSYLNAIGKEIQTLCFEKGLFIRPLGNVIYFMPPYITTKEELEKSYCILEEALGKIFHPKSSLAAAGRSSSDHLSLCSQQP